MNVIVLAANGAAGFIVVAQLLRQGSSLKKPRITGFFYAKFAHSGWGNCLTRVQGGGISWISNSWVSTKIISFHEK